MSDEQSFATIRDGMPRMWWALYQGSLSAGFDRYQAFALVQTYIMSSNPHGNKPPTCQGPESDAV